MAESTSRPRKPIHSFRRIGVSATSNVYGLQVALLAPGIALTSESRKHWDRYEVSSVYRCDIACSSTKTLGDFTQQPFPRPASSNCDLPCCPADTFASWREGECRALESLRLSDLDSRRSTTRSAPVRLATCESLEIAFHTDPMDEVELCGVTRFRLPRMLVNETSVTFEIPWYSGVLVGDPERMSSRSMLPQLAMCSTRRAVHSPWQRGRAAAFLSGGTLPAN